MAATEPTLDDPLLAPIAGPLPAGEDIQLAPDWLAIKDAREADDTGNMGAWDRERKVANWPRVRDLTSEALATKSKDLRLAIWLLEARLRLEGLPALSDGLRLLAGLLANFWDSGLYPQLGDDGDPEYRGAPLEWLNAKLPDLLWDIPLTRRKGTGADYTYLQSVEARQVGFEKDLLNQYGDIDEKKKEQRDAKLAAGKISGELFAEAVAATPRAFYESELERIAEVQRAFAELDKVVGERFGENAPGFGVAREAIGNLKSALERLTREKRQQEPDPVPAQAEEQATAKPEAHPAGIGFAFSGLGAGGSAGSWEHAEALVRGGELQKGLAEMARLAADEHGRTRFLRRLALAEICLAHGREQLAVVILEELARQVETLNLGNWESPELIGRVWGQLYRQYRNTDKSDRGAELYAKLCNLDPWQALFWGDAK